MSTIREALGSAKALAGWVKYEVVAHTPLRFRGTEATGNALISDSLKLTAAPSSPYTWTRIIGSIGFDSC